MRKLSLLVVAVVLTVAVWVYLQRGISSSAKTIACTDISKGCVVDGIKLQFDHMPRMMQPFHLNAEVGRAIEVHASFAMQGMEMGLNRYRLLQQGNVWSAEVMLPVCVRGRSDWFMLLEVQTQNGLKSYQLAFKTSQ